MNPLWRPASPCDVSCLPRPGTGGRVPPARRLLRLAGLGGALLAGVALLAVLPLLVPSWRATVGRRWARAVLRVLGVRLAAAGHWPRRRALLVANHISWLDVVALLAVAPVRMLAKREVRGWPLIGAMAAAGGTIFVDRSRPRALPHTVAAVTAALRAGAVVAAFPEGTTWCGASSGTFRPALFQAAVDAGAPVVPVTVGYRQRGGGRTAAAAFIGADTLWTSLRRVLATPDLEVSVAAAGALRPAAVGDRRALARAAEAVSQRTLRLSAGEAQAVWSECMHAYRAERGQPAGSRG